MTRRHRSIVLTWRWLGVVVIAMLFGALPAHAQQASITIDVRLGFDNAYRTNDWFPIQATITNNGPDLSGRLEWRFPGEQTSEFQREIDLPRGSRKQVTLNVVTNQFYRNGSLLLTSDGKEIARKDLRIAAIDIDQAIFAVASSDPALLNSLNSLTPVNFSSSTVRHIAVGDIPDAAQSLHPVNVLVFHDLDTSALSQAQRDAIAMWVRLGGHLVISGGSNSTNTAAGLGDLLPVELSSNFSSVSLSALTKGGQNSDGLPTNATVNQVTPRQDASVAFAADSTPLVVQQAFGGGTVTFTTFDLAALRGWSDEPAFWQRTMRITPDITPGSQARRDRDNILTDALQLRSLNLLPFWALFGLMVLYILLIGPINYLVLRRAQKLEWAWLSIPLVVVVFVGVVYGIGRLMRGNETRLAQVTIVQGFANNDQALYTTYDGIFSPTRSRYTISYAPNHLAQEFESFDDFSGDSTVVTTDNATEVRDTLVDIGALRTIISESVEPIDFRIDSQYQINNQTISGQLKYTGTLALEDAVLVQGQSYQGLGTLSPGATTSININTTNSGFPWSVGMSEINDIDRQQILNRLTAFDPTGTAMYVFGWRSTPASNIRLNGQAVTPEGVTLYIIRLGSAAN